MCCNCWRRRSLVSSSSSRPATISRKAAGSFGNLLWSISIALLRRRPLGLLQLDRQSHPLVDQFPQPLVVGHLLAHLGQALRPHETRAALAPPRIAELMVRSVLARLLGILALAARRAAHVVLLAEAAGMHGPQFGQALLEFFDLVFNLLRLHTDSLYGLSVSVNKKMQEIQKLILLLSPPLPLRLPRRSPHPAAPPPAGCSVCAFSPCSSRFPPKALPAPRPRSLSAPSPRTDTETSPPPAAYTKSPTRRGPNIKSSLDHSAGCRTPAGGPSTDYTG